MASYADMPPWGWNGLTGYQPPINGYNFSSTSYSGFLPYCGRHGPQPEQPGPSPGPYPFPHMHPDASIPPPPPYCPYPAPPPAKKQEKCQCDDCKKAKSQHKIAAPKMRKGMQYLYPATHTTLHATTIKLWDLPSPQPFSYEIFKVPCNMLVKEVIARLGGGEKGCITECLELGGGRWGKGRAVKAEGKGGNERCDAVGWGEGRGEGGSRFGLLLRSRVA